MYVGFPTIPLSLSTADTLTVTLLDVVQPGLTVTTGSVVSCIGNVSSGPVVVSFVSLAVTVSP